ncbi:sigma 54-interacting transcriptional regulator [Haliangium sp.]|uniref:sigma 54-interacting transcriptional regulator n=1 Tax=Haliangium sp. TaxID=2663208 RepID=UPI003D0FA84B
MPSERQDPPSLSQAETLVGEHQASGIHDKGPYPCLTVLYHPDMTRVGERAILGGLALRKPAILSRLQPKFAPPGEVAGRSLRDPFLSRRPVHISYVDEDQIEIAPEAGVALEVDEQPIDGAAVVSVTALERGLYLTLAHRVVLLLHLVPLRSQYPPAWNLVGDSEAILGVREQITRVGDVDVTVLIRGETGVGKERVAQALHSASRRRERELVAVNMATIPAGTAASELFGHLRGAFTNATANHRGLFERANGSTLFLDEVGEAPPQVQTMLLRTLAEGIIRPLGAHRDQPVDVRVLAATDTDLEQAGEEGGFRSALKYRLAGYEIYVPPLRARREDIPRLAVHFLAQELAQLGEADRMCPPETRRKLWFPPELMLRLVQHDWPGNVRQLRNTVRQLVISGRGADTLRADAAVERLLAEPTVSARRTWAKRNWLDDTVEEARAEGLGTHGLSEETLLAALRAAEWMPSKAAEALGIPRATLYDLMERTPGVRKAGDIPREELERCYRDCDGDLDAMMEQLQVSKRSLQLRLRRLGIRAAATKR